MRIPVQNGFIVDPFSPNVPFLRPLKTSENQRNGEMEEERRNGGRNGEKMEGRNGGRNGALD